MSLHDEAIFAEKAAFVLECAKKYGADEAAVGLYESEGQSIEIRHGKIEALNREQELSIGIAVYLNKAQGMSSLSDWSDAALEAGVKAAIDGARFTEADDCYGLPEADLYGHVSAEALAALELDAGALPNATWLEDSAMRCEAAAMAADSRIHMSDGASADASRSYSYYATSNGFAAGMASTRMGVSISVLARDKDDQQSNYSWDNACHLSDLQTPEAIGEAAARRTVAMLNPRTVQTGSYPVIFAPEVARGLFGHLISALTGASVFRKLGFLADSLGTQILPEWLTMSEHPHIRRSLGSRLIDADGLPAAQGALIENGKVAHYLLNVYGARRMNLAPTGSASGVHNLKLHTNGDQTRSVADLYREMGTGLVVTSLMGQGVNGLTGDYSRGASGFWVENGELVYPVDGATIAGNLREMYQNIIAIGDDVDVRSQIHAPSVLIKRMTVAG